MHLCSIYKGVRNMYDAFICNDSVVESSYFALMQNDHFNTVEKERKNLRVWMRDVMDSHNMSAYEWATKAGTSPTNITRFLKDSKYMPSSKTLAKLSVIVGSHPYANNDATGHTRTLEVLDTEGNRLEYVNVYNVSGKVKAIKLDTVTGYGLGGITENDTVLVREDCDFVDGDVVLIRCCVNTPKEKTLVGQLAGKFIFFKSTVYDKPKAVNECEILGKIIQCIKNF